MKKLIKTLLGLFIIATSQTFALTKPKFSADLNAELKLGSTIKQTNPKSEVNTGNTNTNTHLEKDDKFEDINLNGFWKINLGNIDIKINGELGLKKPGLTQLKNANLSATYHGWEQAKLSLQGGIKDKKLAFGLSANEITLLGGCDASIEIKKGSRDEKIFDYHYVNKDSLNSTEDILGISLKFSRVGQGHFPQNGYSTFEVEPLLVSNARYIFGGLNLDAAYNIEEFPVKKYNLSYKYNRCLNVQKLKGRITFNTNNKDYLGPVSLNGSYDNKTNEKNAYLEIPFKWQVTKNTNMSLTIKPTFKHPKNLGSEPTTTSFFASSNITMPIELKIEWSKEWDQK